MIKPISFGCVCHNYRKINNMPKKVNGYELASDSERIAAQTPDTFQQNEADKQVQLRGYDSARFFMRHNGRLFYNPVKSDYVLNHTTVAISDDGNHIDWCYNFNRASVDD